MIMKKCSGVTLVLGLIFFAVHAAIAQSGEDLSTGITQRLDRLGKVYSIILEERTNFVCSECRRIGAELYGEMMKIENAQLRIILSEKPALSDSATTEHAFDGYLNDLDALCMKYETIVAETAGKSICGQDCNSHEYITMLHLTKEFGSQENAIIILESLDEAILGLQEVLKILTEALAVPASKSDVDEKIRRYYRVSGDIPEIIYNRYISRIQTTLTELQEKRNSPAYYVKNPLTHKSERAKAEGEKSGDLAFVIIGDPETEKQIFLKKGFFSEKLKSRTLTLIHEESHLSSSTEDVPLFGPVKLNYGDFAARFLPPEKAIRDADSFAFLVYYIAPKEDS
jgi:hypothetical protein